VSRIRNWCLWDRFNCAPGALQISGKIISKEPQL